MRPWVAGFALIVLAGMAGAGGWTPLAGADLGAALEARTLQFDSGSWGFRADGTMAFDDGDWREGRWRTEGDRLCTTWPEERESCVAVERSESGLDLRLTARDGTVRVGRYIDL